MRKNLRSLALLGCTAATTALGAPAHSAWQCAATSQGHPLSVFYLYPGDPAEVSNVIPDSSSKTRDGSYSNTWKLDPSDHLIAVCSYEGGEEKQTQLPPGLKGCRASGKPPSFRASCN